MYKLDKNFEISHVVINVTTLHTVSRDRDHISHVDCYHQPMILQKEFKDSRVTLTDP